MGMDFLFDLLKEQGLTKGRANLVGRGRGGMRTSAFDTAAKRWSMTNKPFGQVNLNDLVDEEAGGVRRLQIGSTRSDVNRAAVNEDAVKNIGARLMKQLEEQNIRDSLRSSERAFTDAAEPASRRKGREAISDDSVRRIAEAFGRYGADRPYDAVDILRSSIDPEVREAAEQMARLDEATLRGNSVTGPAIARREARARKLMQSAMKPYGMLGPGADILTLLLSVAAGRNPIDPGPLPDDMLDDDTRLALELSAYGM